MKYLFFDLEAGGHHFEYIQHVVDYIGKQTGCSNEYYFLLNYRFKEKLSLKSENCQIIFDFIDESRAQELFNMKNPIWRSYKIFSLAYNHAKIINADGLIFMSLFWVQFALLFVCSKISLSAIYFAPLVRITPTNTKEKINLWFKKIMIKFILNNKAIKTIYVINDQKACDKLNLIFRCKNFKFLPDPTFDLNNQVGSDNYLLLPEDKIKILHFGSLDDRKGSLELIESLIYLTPDNIEKIALVIAGFAGNDYDKKITDKINFVRCLQSGVTIIYNNEFISDDRKKIAYFKQCDLVAIPNKLTQYASAIMVHAISFGKPMIVPNQGILGETVTENNIGYLIESVAPQEIASVIKRFIANPIIINEKFAQEYYINHSPDKFAEILFTHLK